MKLGDIKWQLSVIALTLFTLWAMFRLASGDLYVR